MIHSRLQDTNGTRGDGSLGSQGQPWLFFSMLIAAAQGVFAFEFAQGVIVDPKASVVYLMNPEGGIDAIALSGGAVLATTTRAAKPLLLYDATLLAQAERKESVLSLAGLNAKDFEPKFTVDVPLASGVQAFVNARLGLLFTRAPARRAMSSQSSGAPCSVK